MKHYVELKLDPVKFDSQLIAKIQKYLEQACSEIAGFLRYELLREKDWSEEKPELLLVLEFTGTDSLETYLKHPIHMQMLQMLKPHMAEKAIFDGLI